MKTRQRRVIALAMSLVAIALFVLAWRELQLRKECQAYRLEMAALSSLAEKPESAPPQTRASIPSRSEAEPLQLPAGSPERVQLMNVRRAYDEIDLKSERSPELLDRLLTLARALRSENPIVRHTTDDIVRHLLTKWVYENEPASWHRLQEVDEFFRLYKRIGSASLQKQLLIFNYGPEARYLSQI